MVFATSNRAGNVRLLLQAHSNCSDVFLAWRAEVDGKWDAEIPNCLGFKIERQRKSDAGWGAIERLHNRVGFANAALEHGGGTGNAAGRPSDVWPFQRYDWTDHDAGDTVMYRVVAVGPGKDSLLGKDKLDAIADSGWTDPIQVTGSCGGGTSAYFNRGFVMSQFVARLMLENDWKVADIKDQVRNIEEPLRRLLAGDLRLQLLRLLDEVAEDPAKSLYAALYELSDDELIKCLAKVKRRAHVVLSNGSDKKGDGNQAARQALKRAGVDVRDRLLRHKGLGHNKFAVVEMDGKPIKVWTGSTNWSASGLCTQANNAIVFEEPSIARLYREQWSRLAEAGNDFTKDLVRANAESPRVSGKTDVWFTCVRRPSKKATKPAADIDILMRLVQAAKRAILYVMFQPGAEPLGSIVHMAKSGLYVRGVVSTLVSGTQERFILSGVSPKARQYKTALVQPEGIHGDFASWIGEVTRAQFLYPNQKPGIGHAITHSKMIVIDPWDDQCVVITGSHNFSVAASERNDENFVVVRGNRGLADAYAVACITTYEHYRWRAYLKDQAEKQLPAWSQTSTKPTWQRRYLSRPKIAHLDGWCPYLHL
jgi:phosphatidylserine/phosphatidylglycerophosphate/cardiolipin synthase-like enzyme